MILRVGKIHATMIPPKDGSIGLASLSPGSNWNPAGLRRIRRSLQLTSGFRTFLGLKDPIKSLKTWGPKKSIPCRTQTSIFVFLLLHVVFFTAPALCAIILREVSPGRVLTEQMIGRSEQNLSPAKCSAVESTRNTEIGSLTEVVVKLFFKLVRKHKSIDVFKGFD